MMQFWGAEVKHGSTLKVQPGDDKLVHLSQACLADIKKDKGNEFIRLYAQKGDQKLVIGILSPEKFPHVNLDLIFEDEFELSHDWKHGNVHVAGYKADNPDPMHEEYESESDEELEVRDSVEVLNNGKPEAKELKTAGNKASSSVKPENAEGKPKVTIVEPAKKNEEDEESDDDDEDDEDESDEDEEEEDEDMLSDEGGSEDDDSSDEEEVSDEETPKKPESSKKRPAQSTSKTPVPDKKAKFSTPQQKTEFSA